MDEAKDQELRDALDLLNDAWGRLPREEQDRFLADHGAITEKVALDSRPEATGLYWARFEAEINGRPARTPMHPVKFVRHEEQDYVESGVVRLPGGEERDPRNWRDWHGPLQRPDDPRLQR